MLLSNIFPSEKIIDFPDFKEFASAKKSVQAGLIKFILNSIVIAPIQFVSKDLALVARVTSSKEHKTPP